MSNNRRSTRTEYASTEHEEREWIRTIELGFDDVDGEEVVLGRSTVEQYQQGPFSTEIRDEEMKKTVNDKGLYHPLISVTLNDGYQERIPHNSPEGHR